MCLNQVLAITFELFFESSFQGNNTCQVLVMCQVPGAADANGVSLKRAFKMQFGNAYFRSLVHSSQKLWPKFDSTF